MLAVGIYGADVGKTIFYSLLVGLPTAIIAGPLFGSFISRRIQLSPSEELAAQFSESQHKELPGFGITVFTILLPVILMLCATVADVTLAEGSAVRTWIDFIGSPIVSLLIALLFAFFSLGFARGFSRDDILKFTNECLGPTATILIVIGAGGGFNKVLIESGVGDAIAGMAAQSHISPVFLSWLIAGLIRGFSVDFQA